MVALFGGAYKNVAVEHYLDGVLGKLDRDRRPRWKDLQGHRVEFADRQRVRLALRRPVRDPRPARARQRRVRSRRRDGPRDRACHRAPRLRAGRGGEARRRDQQGGAARSKQAARRRGRSLLQGFHRRLFAPAGARRRPHGDQDDRQGRLRSLRREPLPGRTRPRFERAPRVPHRPERDGRQARHPRHASVHAGTGRGGCQGRARHRRPPISARATATPTCRPSTA